MEHYDPTRRQYPPQSYASQQGQQASAPGQSQYLQQLPPVSTSSGRESGGVQQIYGFGPGSQYGQAAAMQPNQLQFGQDMQSPETHRQPQQYPQYGSNVMYGIQPGQPPYEELPQYRQRAGTGSETLAAPFGVPQGGQYYLAASSASTPQIGEQNIPSQYQHSDTYAHGDTSTAQSYGANMMDPSFSASFSAYPQQSQYPTQYQSRGDDQTFERYQNQIRNIFTLAHDGTLRDVHVHLLEISHYLLGNAEALGLTRDDETLHDGRIRLWDEFNRAWLVTLQRQYDLTQEMSQTNQPLAKPQSIMTIPALENLSQELLRLCDSVEKHGLVDYQMGVEEEQIVELILRCIALPRSVQQSTDESEQAGSSSSRTAPGR